MKKILLLFILIFAPLTAHAQNPTQGSVPEICVTSATQTPNYNQVCISASSSGGNIGLTSFGSATGTLTVGGGAIFPVLPPFNIVCNPLGITAQAIACPAFTVTYPLTINSNVLSVAGVSTSNNTFYGFNSGNLTGTGVNNVAVGFSTLNAYTSGGNNTAIGGQALQHSTTGSQNMALGYNAMAGLLTGVNNVAVGYQSMLVAGAVSAANGNTAIGEQSMRQLTSGAINTAVGEESCNAITTGQFNICIGGVNGGTGSHSFTTGSRNTSICSYAAGATLGITTGTDNVVIGCPTGLATNSVGKLILADGSGNIRADYGNTTASVWTFGAAVTAPTLTATAVAPTVAAGQIGYGSTITAAAAGTCPATMNTSISTTQAVAGCIVVNIAGTARNVPFF